MFTSLTSSLSSALSVHFKAETKIRKVKVNHFTVVSRNVLLCEKLQNALKSYVYYFIAFQLQKNSIALCSTIKGYFNKMKNGEAGIIMIESCIVCFIWYIGGEFYICVSWEFVTSQSTPIHTSSSVLLA